MSNYGQAFVLDAASEPIEFRRIRRRGKVVKDTTSADVSWFALHQSQQ
jgi:hypothetical protein